jgi:hypothetical protein
MLNHMRDMVAIEELEQHILHVKTTSRKSSPHPTLQVGDHIFTVHPNFDSDELAFDTATKEWIRPDPVGNSESRFAHPLLSMQWINQQVLPLTAR